MDSCNRIIAITWNARLFYYKKQEKEVIRDFASHFAPERNLP